MGAIVVTLMGAVRTPLRAWHARRVAEAEAAAAAGLLHAFPLQLHTDRHVHACFRVLYALCKTRGAKAVAKFLPHEVADLEPAAQALTCQVRERAPPRAAGTALGAGASGTLALIDAYFAGRSHCNLGINAPPRPCFAKDRLNTA